jgi:putative aldouronate transport system permease protein
MRDLKIKRKDSAVLRFTQVGPFANALFNVLFIILAALCVVPFLLVISISFSSEQSIRDFGYQFIPRVLADRATGATASGWSVEGYAYLYQQRDMMLRAFGMSVLVTALGTALGVVLNSTMGYILSRKDYKAHNFFVWFVFIPMIFGGGLVSSYYINSQFLGLKNTMWALILPLAVSSYNAILCKTFFKATIPDSIIESAVIDGASQWTIYFRMILPLSLPVLATIALFMSFGYWNDWYQAMLYLDSGAGARLYTLQAFLNRLLSDINYLAQNAAKLGVSQAELMRNMPKEAARMAIVVVATVPIAVAYPFFQRYFVSGLTVGSVKG